MTEALPKILRLNPPDLPDSTQIGYSQITIAEPGRMAHVSGQVASGAGGEAPPEDLSEQTRQVINNLGKALNAIGATVRDIVLLRIYVVDLDQDSLGRSFPLILEFLAGAQPSITGIGVAALAGPGLKIEIEMMVSVPDAH